jgi:hypothetical protein
MKIPNILNIKKQKVVHVEEAEVAIVEKKVIVIKKNIIEFQVE